MARFSRQGLVRASVVAVVVSACGGGSSAQPETAPAPVTTAPTRPDAAAGSGAVKSETIQQSPKESDEKYLEGRVAGVVVQRTQDGGIAVRVRGGSSLMGNNEPLYIVDGSPFLPGPNGALTGINPYDIESIKVLKDPADLSMYGVRGANGVIVIKTKMKR